LFSDVSSRSIEIDEDRLGRALINDPLLEALLISFEI